MLKGAGFRNVFLTAPKKRRPEREQNKVKTYEIHGQKITARDLLDGVFGSGALSEWEWWSEIRFIHNRDGALAVGMRPTEFGDYEVIKKTITSNDLAEAARVVVERYRLPINKAVLELDNLDADGADLILQQAVFGEVIYG